MAKRMTSKVPDAWEDDDWEAQADKAATTKDESTSTSQSQSQPQPRLSKAERLAQHAESNKKLWESAEAPPGTFHYLAARSDPPLATGFKPAVKVLSRKPTPSSGDPHNRDGDDEDDEDGKKTPQLTPQEIQLKQQREREEKQRRYNEARAKIFGTSTTQNTNSNASAGVGSSNPSSGASTPGAVTPPRSAEGRGPRGRGRGGRGGGGGGHRHNESRGERDRGDRGDRDRDNNIQRPGSQASGGRELYDPNYSPKPGFQLERRANSNSNNNNNNSDGGAPLYRRSTPRDEEQVIRAPRGPDGSGRGGFGFAKRGAKGS
ncbi:uncharacterized protein F4812DRAFT_400242 [Daldinia caldariorum]|uniref:uncharacterized protein n=1 Tax=Daldinia caldariorum TaxID=326644 RepID=UPI002008E864|nr:uncharacterized protein F4812DRAFT_400242 [Daldinia caldariorum]KAI1467528.1 hypothetical protein F4812DRAFT_400242 [Daldinia caldariorum]